MNKTTIAVEHNDIIYVAELVTIKSTFLGIEDHGIMTAQLNCEWPGSGISTGGYSLDGPVKDDKDHVHRFGTAFGMDHIMQIMAVVGVSQWEKLAGRNVLVLFAPDKSGGPAVGIASITHEDRVLIYQEHCDAWKDRKSS